MDNFEQIKDLVLHYLRGIWKNRWLAIFISWIVFTIGVVVIDQLKDRYKAETRVYIDTTSVLGPLLKGLAVETDIQSNINLMIRKLLSRPNLERAIRLMDMDINTQTNEDMDLLVESIKQRVSVSSKAISRKSASNIYEITYEDTNPQVAKKMVQTLLDIFVEDSLGKSAKESDSAISFLDKQISKYEGLLEDAEQRLESFKRKNVGKMPKDGGNYFKNLQLINGQYEQALLLKQESEKRRDQIKSQLNKLSMDKAVDETSSKYDVRIAQLESDLENLLLNYTEAHPDVINTQRIIDSLKKKREEDINNVSETTTVATNENPVYQELQILLGETEADIASLSARVLSYSKKQESLKQFVNIIPAIESELKKLNRNYDVHKQNYQELVQRREQALISDDVESGSEQIQFRIIEPPRVPGIASFPNRPLFDAAALVLALGVGYGIGLLVSLAKPVFYNVRDLSEYTGLAVLGSVAKLDTEEVLSARKRNVYLFLLVNVLLIVTALAVIYLHSQNIILVQKVLQLMN